MQSVSRSHCKWGGIDNLLQQVNYALGAWMSSKLKWVTTMYLTAQIYHVKHKLLTRCALHPTRSPYVHATCSLFPISLSAIIVHQLAENRNLRVILYSSFSVSLLSFPFKKDLWTLTLKIILNLSTSLPASALAPSASMIL